jgi:hypothetical protein
MANYSAKLLAFFDFSLLYGVLNQGTGKKITAYLHWPGNAWGFIGNAKLKFRVIN